MNVAIRRTKHFFNGGCSSKKTIIPFIEVFYEDIYDDEGNKEGTFKTLALDFWVKWLDDGHYFAGGRHFQYILPVGIFK